MLIDDQPANLASDGAFESPGWDMRENTVLVRRPSGDIFASHDGGGVGTLALPMISAPVRRFVARALTGLMAHVGDRFASRLQIRLLVGARPGDIFRCQSQRDVRSETILALVPFAPVWALPIDPVHADKRSARLVPLDSAEPVSAVEHSNRTRRISRALRIWVTVVNDAGRKQLALSVESVEAKALWRRYRVLAKQLWKKMR